MARSALLVSIVLGTAFGHGGCKERVEAPDVSVERPRSGPQHADKKPTLAKAGTQQLSTALANKTLAPVDIAAASTLLPSDFGAVVVEPLAPIGQGRQAQQTLCYEKLGSSKATKKLTAALEAAGWKDVQSREHRRAEGRFSLSANKDGHRLAASIQTKPGHQPCEEGAAAVLTLHHLVDRGARPSNLGIKGRIYRPGAAQIDTTAGPP